MKDNIITVIGSLNYDIIFKQSKLAQKGETLTADSVTFSGGGKGANQAVQCARLGAQTYMVGAVGNDNFGDYLVQQLSNYGVNTEHIRKVSENTGLGVVNSLQDGTVVATISTGANYAIAREHIDEIDHLLEKSKIVILQMEIPVEVVEYAIDKAFMNGCFIILNAAPAKAISEKALSKVNCLVMNEPEASFYCNEVINDLKTAKEHCEKLHKKARDLIIITLGANGSLLFDGKNKIYIEPKKVEAVETTGAGDSYIGAFAYKLLQESEFVEAARFAALAGAFTVTKVGAQGSMPDTEEIMNFK